MLIAIANSKGGVGKSTIAVHLSVWLAEQGLRVATIDADPQASLSTWLPKVEPNVPIKRYQSAAEILRYAPRLRDLYDVVVTDSPAALCTELGALLTAADVALLPINASMLDVWASYRTARLIYRARFAALPHDRPVAITVLNRARPRARLARIAAEAVRQFGFPVALNALAARTAYAEAAGAGAVVWRMGVRAQAAASEVLGLFGELFEIRGDIVRATAAVECEVGRPILRRGTVRLRDLALTSSSGVRAASESRAAAATLTPVQ